MLMLVMLYLLVALVAVVVILHLSAAPFAGVGRVGVVEPSLDNGQGVGEDVPSALEQIVSQE